MRSRVGPWASGAFAWMLALSVSACGGGKTAVVGLGNSDNRIVEGGTLEAVAEALAERTETPYVSDELLGRVFSAILERATEGDPEAALIVLRVAEEQREQSAE